MTRPARRRTAGGVCAVLLVAAGGWWGGAEWLQRRASRRPPGSRARADGLLGALVLGCPSERSGCLTAEQAWRCDILMRTLGAHRGPVRVVFSGGRTTPAPLTEAASMAAHCVERLGLDPAVVELEETAASTTENIRFGLPLLADCDRITIVSNPLHAARGRRDVATEFPDVVPRLAFADDYRPGERFWHKPRVTWHESVVGLWYRWHDRGRGPGAGQGSGRSAQ